MKYVLALLGYPLLVWVVWVLFIAIMRLQEVRDAGKLTKVAYAFGMPLLILGYLLDFLLNVASSVLFLEVPREWLLSARVSRHINEEGFRGRLSRWVCHNLLDPFDPSGCHCK